MRVANNILWNDSGYDLKLAGPAYLSHNDIGHRSGLEPQSEIAPLQISPIFNPGTYSLSQISPLRDAGINSVPGGVGLVDIDSNPRIAGSAVDLGAHEHDAVDSIFTSGFECSAGCPSDTAARPQV